ANRWRFARTLRGVLNRIFTVFPVFSVGEETQPPSYGLLVTAYQDKVDSIRPAVTPGLRGPSAADVTPRAPKTATIGDQRPGLCFDGFYFEWILI
ncbi:MAG: hypothetical protein AAFN74_03570, partial [Myxococcota bacterium]